MDNEYVGVFHGDEKLDNMLNQMVSYREPYRLVYRWISKRELSFREFTELMTTYERMIRN